MFGGIFFVPMVMVLYLVIVMPTTVQVDEETLQMLNKLKKETKARSHDEVIRALIVERNKVPCSMFGSNRKLKAFSMKDEAESHSFVFSQI